MQKPEVVKMTLALPADIRRWVENKAAADLATMNAFIVISLRRQMQERVPDRVQLDQEVQR